MNNIYVILTEPIYKGNIGSVSRIMHNFGFANLRIVGSIPEKEDFVMGVHSQEIMDQATTYDTLKSAISDLDRVVALSRRKGAKKQADMNPKQLAEYVHNTVVQAYMLDNLTMPCHLPPVPCKLGLVFGRETFGLTDEEAELCDLRCYIPANPDFPSINLAQAVTIVLYEIYNECEVSRVKGEKEPVASKSEIETSVQYSLEVMQNLNCFRDQPDKKYFADYLSSLLYRSNATKQMAIDLKKVFNRIHLAFFGKGKGF